MIRKAVVRRGRFEDVNELLQRTEALLPSNYSAKLTSTVTRIDGVLTSVQYILVEGEDNAGWTLEDYVIPRAASGLIFMEEVSA